MSRNLKAQRNELIEIVGRGLQAEERERLPRPEAGQTPMWPVRVSDGEVEDVVRGDRSLKGLGLGLGLALDEMRSHWRT